MSGVQRRRRRESGRYSWLQFLLRWSYGRWVQLLAFGDLLGSDGRPSQSKLAAFTVLAVGCFVGVWQAVHVERNAGAVGAATVTLILAGLSASFGIRTYNYFLSRTRVALEAKQLDVTMTQKPHATMDENEAGL